MRNAAGYKVRCDECSLSVINGHATHESGCSGGMVFTRRGREYTSFSVYSLDVWGNRRDGFEVNDRSRLGAVFVPRDFSDRDVVRALKGKGWLRRGCRFSSFRLDGGDGSMLGLDVAKTGEPLFQLEAA